MTKRLVPFVCTFLIVYGLAWALHWRLLTAPGPGDQWFSLTGNFWQDTWTAHKHMLSAGVGLAKGHQDASRPWGWFLMHTPIYYWTGGGPSAGKIYFLGNPAVWWGGSAVFFGALITRIWRTFRQKSQGVWWSRNALPLVAFVGSFGPLVPLSRPLFLYHFLTPLLFVIIVASIEIARFVKAQPPGRRRNLWLGLTATVILGFIYVAPFTYGTATLAWLPETLFTVFPKWR